MPLRVTFDRHRTSELAWSSKLAWSALEFLAWPRRALLGFARGAGLLPELLYAAMLDANGRIGRAPGAHA